jgi:microcystin degradation protein MlrC
LRKVVVVKSMQHFQAAFAQIARRVLLVNSGGICNPDYSAFQYNKIRRPIFPLDAVGDDWRRGLDAGSGGLPPLSLRFRNPC